MKNEMQPVYPGEALREELEQESLLRLMGRMNSQNLTR